MPSLSEELTLASDAAYDLEGMRCTEEDASGADVGNIDIQRSDFSRCDFLNARFSGSHFDHVVFAGCDFSGTRFYEVLFKHVIFRDCRLMGTVFQDCILEDTKMESCQGRYMNLSSNTLKRFTMDGGSYRSAYLARCKTQKVTVKDCDFTGCDFTGTNLSGFDFSTCSIDGSIWSLDRLKNATVSPEQALDFARLLGLNIR